MNCEVSIKEVSTIPSLFSGPPRLPPQPVLKPGPNSLLTQQLQSLGRRSGENGAVLTPIQQQSSAPATRTPGSALTRSLTGS